MLADRFCWARVKLSLSFASDMLLPLRRVPPDEPSLSELRQIRISYKSMPKGPTVNLFHMRILPEALLQRRRAALASAARRIAEFLCFLQQLGLFPSPLDLCIGVFCGWLRGLRRRAGRVEGGDVRRVRSGVVDGAAACSEGWEDGGGASLEAGAFEEQPCPGLSGKKLCGWLHLFCLE